MTVYLVENEKCNGEYGETMHRSLHYKLEDAKKQAVVIPTPEEDQNGVQDQWEQSQFDPEGVLEFRTGNWGFNVWKIYPLEVN